MNEFVWADLSTYNPQSSMQFYQNVFGWQFHDAGGYQVAMQGSNEIAGLFETPDFFKKIKMPHFWMSYILVEDTMATAELASQFVGARVEMTNNFYGGNIALIRDSQGAGFTVYEGSKLNARKKAVGHMTWNELHVSDVSAVLPFYQDLFGWEMRETQSEGVYEVFNKDRLPIANIFLLPNQLKGKYEYWVCTFAVENLLVAKRRVIENRGGVVFDEGRRIMMHDDSGEAFFYIQQFNG